MKPLRHTGNSANIAYYAEPTTNHGDVWAEVLRMDWYFRPMRLRPRPEFRISVRRIGVGEVASRKYTPRKPVPAGPLAAEVVTRLVRQMLKGARWPCR